MRMLNVSLNQKLIGITIAAFVIIIGLGTVNQYKSVRKENIAYQREKVISVSDSVRSGIMILILENRCAEVPSFMKKAARDKNIGLLRVFRAEDGVILISAGESAGDGKLGKTDYERYAAHRDGEPFFITENKTKYFVRFLPIATLPPCQVCPSAGACAFRMIEFRIPVTGVYSLFRPIVIDNLVFALLSIVLFSLVFSFIVIKLIHEPLDEIMEMIQYVEDGNFKKRVTVKHDDIIGRLAEKFNSMTWRISESQKEVEAYHRAQMKRASQMAMIGEIASGIAHEIKNPLACISAALQVIEGDLEEKNEHKMVIREVVNQVKRLDGTVKKILEFAKPVSAEKKLTAIDEVLQETLLLISQFANQKSIEVNVSGGEGIKKVYGDGKALRQVFLNICLNAIEAMQEKGVLDIAVAMTYRERAGGAGEYVEVMIRDTGSGIAEENLVEIFDPFFTTKKSGTGLGLSISAQIVEEHGGFIEVESEVGEGTTFEVYLPAVNENR
ncbi:MAG: two-component system sensor histidine kinase NtrB [Syntrophales bacterium]